MKPDPWEVKLWFANMERQLKEEVDYPWWLQVLPLTSGVGAAAEEFAKQLARQLVASWRWIKQLQGPELCLPVPSLLNIAQFLDKVPGCQHTEEEWLLVYARVLQCVAEASVGHEWVNTYPHPMVHTADLVKAFMMATEVQHEARDIARCWGEPPDLRPTRPRVQEFTRVTSLLDSMAVWVPLQ